MYTRRKKQLKEYRSCAQNIPLKNCRIIHILQSSRLLKRKKLTHQDAGKNDRRVTGQLMVIVGRPAYIQLTTAWPASAQLLQPTLRHVTGCGTLRCMLQECSMSAYDDAMQQRCRRFRWHLVAIRFSSTCSELIVVAGCSVGYKYIEDFHKRKRTSQSAMTRGSGTEIGTYIYTHYSKCTPCLNKVYHPTTNIIFTVVIQFH